MKKWLIARRISQILVLFLFLITPLTKSEVMEGKIPAFFEMKTSEIGEGGPVSDRGIEILEGNLTSSEFLDFIPMTDPFAALQVMLATGDIYKTALIGAGIILLFYIIVGGRLFCSWVCPMNMVTDFAHSMRKRFNIERGRSLDRNTRYWILGTVLIVTAVTGVTSFEIISPVAMLHRELIFGAGAGLLLVAAIFLFDLLVFYRGWCSSLCPLGAFYSLVGKLSLLRVRFSDGLCDSCGDCFPVCAEAQVLGPSVKDREPVILSGNCTNCGNCIDICPPKALKFGLRFKR
ncbi:MAG: quinol dehydrogenase ferredoxin subunit NapH [Deltaproteobacteria bacterium]|nr:quinol dehydrogenase ferredoxin subunit NapH [Deltaproteobacteria bacterium]